MPAEKTLVVVSWQTASGLSDDNDYSAATVWALVGTDFYLLDIVRERLDIKGLQRRIEDASRRHRVHATLMEKAHIGLALWQEMRWSSPVRLILRPVKGEKRVRLALQAPKFEAGQVLLPHEAPWLSEYMAELLAFLERQAH